MSDSVSRNVDAFLRGNRANVTRSERPCSRCRHRGQAWTGEAPKCGFPDCKSFVSSNWNCATLNELRDHAEPVAIYNDDQWLAVLPMEDEGRFIVLSWYKHRGRTEGAWMINGSDIEPLHIRAAEGFLNGRK